MRSIERLPESVHSSVRSGVVICDLTRIVEELVFNSLDAGATKVSVAVGVCSCYVKVVDNGSGITRDGLVLLGERQATSKNDHLAVMDTGSESFDFHGEALCSISNVSLLEIVTKARGKPNGYRKIMKNSKCLFLGIDDDRQDVGTTVIVRDIFYNQPVRRKHMESSAKKMLDSIKMSLLRVALVHVTVCFKVVDVESADELLHTGPSSSPLSLLSSNLGTGNSDSFYKVDFCDGELKLSGFISDPYETFYLKAIQYVYINSRFICKGPIHKLVNQLVLKFDSSCSWLPATWPQNEKQNKFDPTFILNLCCPRSYYHMITSEQSRRSVEFKDWGPVLTFIENGIMRLWAQNISHDTSRMGKKRYHRQNCQISPDFSSPQVKKPHKSYDIVSALQECVSSFEKPSKRASELAKNHIEAGFPSETDYLSRSCDGSLPGRKVTRNKDIWSHLSCGRVSSLDHVPHAYDTKLDGLSSSSLGDILPTFDENMDDISTSTWVAADCLKFSDDIHFNQDPSKSFLRTCSFERGFRNDRRLRSRDEQFEFESGDDIRIRKRWIDCNDSMLDEINLAICGRDVHCSGAAQFGSLPMTQYNKHEISEFPIEHSVSSSLVSRNMFSDSSKQVWKYTSCQQSSRPRWSPMSTKKIIGMKFHDDDSLYKTSVEDYSMFGAESIFGYPAQREEDLKCSNLNAKDRWQQLNLPYMCSSSEDNRGIAEFHWGDVENVFFAKPFQRFSETDRSPLPSNGEGGPKNYLVRLSCDTPSWKHECGRADIRNQIIFNRKNGSVRSHSAPPCYEGKKRYIDLTDTSAILSARSNFSNTYLKLSSNVPNTSNHATTKLKCLQTASGPYHQSAGEKSVMDGSFAERQALESTLEIVEKQNGMSQKSEQFVSTESVECLDVKEIQHPSDSGCKWWNFTSTTGGNVPDCENQDNILDISSGVLHLASDSLVPKSIDKMSFEDAKVLSQVDKKFIPVVAGKTLAVIDQHAADERIRLEELRRKVLSGEMKTITYLDAERELDLPEMGYQLLHNYAEQIEKWGWICNIHSQDMNSFAKHFDLLHRQPIVVKLLAVPCILGVDLTDIDLLEYLQQLADTDGSSTIPPAVHRVLNNKACRGAIMFGDTLLLSECSLIVEELKRTSLCFQCAHGRPTTVPLINLDLLHNKITKHSSCELWHGLRQHKLSLERSTQRLNSAPC